MSLTSAEIPRGFLSNNRLWIQTVCLLRRSPEDQQHCSAPVGVRTVCLLRLYIYILATVFVPPVDTNTLLAKMLHSCSAFKITVNISVTLNRHYGCLRLKISMILLRLVRLKCITIPSRFFKRYQYLLSSLVTVLGGVVVSYISVSKSVAVPSQ